MKISADFPKNVAYVKEAIDQCPDYIINELKLKDGTRLLLLCIDNMVDSQILYYEVIPRIMAMTKETFSLDILPFASVTVDTTLDDALAGVATGGTFFLLEGMRYGFEVRVEKLFGRTPEASETEKNLRGSRDSFVENINMNMAILRTKVGNHNLKYEEHTIGASTHQKIIISYIKGIANEKLLAKLRQRIKDLNFDGYLSTGYVEQMIADRPRSPFPQFEATERTDKTVAGLLEGKFAIFVNGAPEALLMPVCFWGFFQAMDDYSHSPWVGSMLGIFRFISLFIAIFLPSIYITILSFHYYITPISVISTLVNSRNMVIFSPLLEAVIMEFLFEIIRESAVRLPTYVGSTLGIVGGIIIGQAAVEVGLVSNYMVIVVSVTAIAGFVVPSQDMAYTMRLVRFLMMFFAGFFGFIGMLVGGSLLLIHLIQVESLGRPYLLPMFPAKPRDTVNTVIRLPFRFLRFRPSIAKPEDKIRGKNRGK
ncbi:MAG: spore germination protein [Bacillota bacterium]|nr:spore germination protein [Bacillota bacterium]